MEQFNVYKDGVKVAMTDDATFEFKGLESDTEYVLGVSRVVDGRESDISTIEVTTEAELEPEPEPEPEVESVEESTELDVAQYHTGGGWYELPNGEKVQGKDNAIAALEDLTDE